jgi:hypothetical protein
MGKTSGSNQLVAAASETFAGDSQPLTAATPCKRGKTLLKVYLRRKDTDAAIGNETVHAGKTSPGAAKTTAGGTGLADYGAVDPGDYNFDVTLSGTLKPKFQPFTTQKAKLPKQVQYSATLRLLPVAQLSIVVLDGTGKALNGAAWALSEPVAASGTTGGSGRIDVEVPWNTTAAKLKITPPAGKRIGAPAVVAADPPNAPPYPVTVRPSQWDPAPAKAKDTAATTWILQVQLLPDSDDDDGAKARLVNLGFPCTNGPRTTRSVKAFQRMQNKDYAGSGALDDVKADLKNLHDTL